MRCLASFSPTRSCHLTSSFRHTFGILLKHLISNAKGFFWNPLLFRRSDAPTRAKWHLSGEWEQFRPNDLPVAVNDSWQLESTADFSGRVLYFNQLLPTVLLKEPYKKPDVKKRRSIFKRKMSHFSHQRSLATELNTFYIESEIPALTS